MKRYNRATVVDFLSRPSFDEKIIMSHDSSWPKISIVTPSFNQDAFLEKTIVSVLNQNYPNLEYIIIDGGSSDESVAIIKKYERYLAYWESTPDRGQAHALNKGFQRCTGELVGWQNSDDFYLPGAVKTVASLFVKRPTTDVFFGDKFLVDDEERYLSEFKYVPFSLGSLIHEGNIIVNESAFWKRGLFAKVGYLDEQRFFSMDYDFFLRLGLVHARFRHIPLFLGAMHCHPATKTATIWQRKIADDKEILKKYLLKRNKLLGCWYGMRRVMGYLRYGDIRYVAMGVGRLLRRLKKA